MPDYSALTPANAPVVVIEWQDIQTHDSWNDDEVPETYGALSVGWLLESTNTRIVLGTSYSYDDDRWSGFITFPVLPPVAVEVGVYDERTRRAE